MWVRLGEQRERESEGEREREEREGMKEFVCGGWGRGDPGTWCEDENNPRDGVGFCLPWASESAWSVRFFHGRRWLLWRNYYYYVDTPEFFKHTLFKLIFVTFFLTPLKFFFA